MRQSDVACLTVDGSFREIAILKPK